MPRNRIEVKPAARRESAQEVALDKIRKGVLANKDRYLPDIGGWTNRGYAILRAKYGDATCDKFIREQFERPPPGCCSGGDGLKKLNRKCRILALKMAVGAKLKKVVLSHPVGVGATGRATVVDNPLVPKTSSFLTGKTFDVQMRHGRFGPSVKDDRFLGGWSLSIKLSDGQTEWDLMANTGRLSSFYDYRTLMERLSKTKVEDAVKSFKKFPILCVAYIDSLRVGPKSLTDLYYHYYPTHEFIADDNVARWARFQIIPGNHEPEDPIKSGFLSFDRQVTLLTNVKPEQNDNRSPTYLRDEFLEQVKNNGVRYTVQIQIRTEIDHEAFNVARPWDDKLYPWLDLIDVDLDSPMGSDELKTLAFSACNLPPCLQTPIPEDEWDFKSIQYIRTKVYPRVQKARVGKLSKTKKWRLAKGVSGS